MTQDAPRDTGRVSTRWVWATFLGWFLGFLLLLALVVPGDMIGGGAQFPVGVGLGAGIGFLQGRFLRPWLGSPLRWTAASTLGLGAPFLLHDLLGALGGTVPYSLPAYILLGSLLVGVAQQRFLRAVGRGTIRWVPATVAGWALPVALLILGEAGVLPEIVSRVSSLAGMFLGGLLLGAVTGPVLASILTPSRQ